LTKVKSKNDDFVFEGKAIVAHIRDKSLYADFILDRAALGATPKEIKEACFDLLDYNISLSSLNSFVVKNELIIQEKKIGLRKEIAHCSPSVLSRLENISYAVESKLANADDDVFARLLPAFLRNLELIARVLGEIKEEKVVVNISEEKLNSLEGLNFLHEKKIIQIVDSKKLEGLLHE